VTSSVCLCTYNGERYLEAQLASLARQSVLPSELLVGDDRSSDATAGIVERFSQDAPFPVDFRVNEERLGLAANLERLLQAASGDVVFPCDQDDIWHSGKIARMTALLDGAPEAGAAVCNSALVDQDGQPLGETLFGRVGLEEATRRSLAHGSSASFLEIARRNVVASHALAIRQSSLALVLPMDVKWHADWWIALVLAGVTGLVLSDETLVDYRLHESNAVGLRTHRPMRERASAESIRRYSSRAELLDAAITRVRRYREDVPSPTDSVELDAQIAHLRARASLSPGRWGRSAAVLVEARSGRYARFSNGWRSVLSDLWRSS
jgi:glycosyltransferase involved in cell wall biosynthesis